MRSRASVCFCVYVCVCACVCERPVNKSYNDVFDIDVLVELSTCSEKRVQGLEVELVWENLQRKRQSVWIARNTKKTHIFHLFPLKHKRHMMVCVKRKMAVCNRRARGDGEMKQQGEISPLKCMVLCANVLYLYNTLHEILLCQRISAVHHLLQHSWQNNLRRTHIGLESTPTPHSWVVAKTSLTFRMKARTSKSDNIQIYRTFMRLKANLMNEWKNIRRRCACLRTEADKLPGKGSFSFIILKFRLYYALLYHKSQSHFSMQILARYKWSYLFIHHFLKHPRTFCPLRARLKNCWSIRSRH